MFVYLSCRGLRLLLMYFVIVVVCLCLYCVCWGGGCIVFIAWLLFFVVVGSIFCGGFCGGFVGFFFFGGGSFFFVVVVFLGWGCF